MSPSVAEAQRLEVHSLQETGLEVNKPIAFKVQCNGARGHVDGKVTAPSGGQDDCCVDPIDDDTYAVRFIPREVGVHRVHVRYDSVHIPGSPFHVRVGKDSEIGDPSKVRCYGEGLVKASTSQAAYFFANTVDAGAGPLAISVDGPSKVQLDSREEREGYSFSYVPLSPGDYYISIKFCGQQVPGSPYQVKVTDSVGAGRLAEEGPHKGGSSGVHESTSMIVESITKTYSQTQQTYSAAMPKFNSDATKVTSHGMGLKKAFLHKDNTFQVNCKNAGNNMLLVGVYGPKHPCEQVNIKHEGQQVYTVNYVVKDKGDYILVVKWGDEHIPGSPFHISV